jgi:hypothetical protein
MILTLNDGTKLEVLDYSFPDMLVIEADVNTVKTVVEKITTTNLKNATLDGNVFLNVVYVNSAILPIDENTGKYTVTVYLRQLTDIDIINERLDEQDAALMELAELIEG